MNGDSGTREENAGRGGKRNVSLWMQNGRNQKNRAGNTSQN